MTSKENENPRLAAFREYRSSKDAAETQEQRLERRDRLAKELWALDRDITEHSKLPSAPSPAEETAREKLRLAYALLDNYPEDQLVDMGKAKVLIGEVIATADKCEGGESCWHNPQTGYLEACPKHEAIAMDRMMEIEASRRAQPEPVSPEGSAEDEIDALINEVAPPPLVVSETAIRQLRPLLLELIARRKAEELIQELIVALGAQIPSSRNPADRCWCSQSRNLDKHGHSGQCLQARTALTRAAEYRKGAKNVR